MKSSPKLHVSRVTIEHDTESGQPVPQTQLIPTINIWKCFSISIYGEQNCLKSVVLISKHLTLEWWLLAGEYACCLSRLHLKKMTEFLSDTYSTACVRRARSRYTRLLWSFSNFPKLGWPLLSGKLDWLEWFSLEKLCCWCSYTKGKAYERLHIKTNKQKPAKWKSVGMQNFSDPFTRVWSVSYLWHTSSVTFSPAWFSGTVLQYRDFVRPYIESLLWNQVLDSLNQCRFLESAAVKCSHIEDFDASSMFAAEDSPCDLPSLSCLNPGPPSPCPKSKFWVVKNT